MLPGVRTVVRCLVNCTTVPVIYSMGWIAVFIAGEGHRYSVYERVHVRRSRECKALLLLQRGRYMSD